MVVDLSGPFMKLLPCGWKNIVTLRFLPRHPSHGRLTMEEDKCVPRCQGGNRSRWRRKQEPLHLFLLSSSSSVFQDFWLISSQFCFPRGSVYSSSSSFPHPLIFFFCGIYSTSPDASSSLLCWPTLVSDTTLFLHFFAFSLVFLFLLLLLPVDSSQLIRLFRRQKDFREPQCFIYFLTSCWIISCAALSFTSFDHSAFIPEPLLFFASQRTFDPELLFCLTWS